MKGQLDNLRDYVQWFTNTGYFPLISFILAIVGIALAYVFYKRSRRIVRLNQRVISYTLIENSVSQFPKLRIFYDEQQLTNFSISQLKVKNVGTVSIRRDDVAPGDPINISLYSEAKMLESDLIYQSNKSSKVELQTIEPNSRLLVFDYLNPGDYVIVRVFHTGTKEDSLRISGSVIGEDKPFSLDNPQSVRKAIQGFSVKMMRIGIDPTYKWLPIAITFSLGALALGYGFMAKPRFSVWLGMLVFGIYMVFSAIRAAFTKRKSVDPDELNEVLQDVIDFQGHELSRRMKEAFRKPKNQSKS